MASRRGEIQVDVVDGLGWITIARPEKKNALTIEMWCALPGALRSLADRNGVVGVVLRGQDGNFGAGADLEDVLAATAGADEAEAYCTDVVRAILALATTPLPTLALLEGVAAGGAAELAIACDLRFADPGSSLTFPFARLGVVPDRFTLGRLVALVGASTARRVVFTGESIAASRALGLGLVDEVVAPMGLDAAVSAWATTLGKGSRQARADMKALFLEGEAVRDIASLIGPMIDSFVSGDVRAAALRFLGRA